MCGIAGYINTNNKPISNTSVIREMLTVQKHRGPDDSGIRAFSLQQQSSKEFGHTMSQNIEEHFEGILGFNRLSILDLSNNGHQPMCSTDEKVMLTMNGEIYNAFDLKPALAAGGYPFKSNTDTEVVLALYLKYGFDEMLKQLNGMFAIVIVDFRLCKLFIARDRFGIKPLYYYHKNGVLAFSSELKSFYALPEFSAAINEDLLDEYLLFRNNINNTLIKDVQGISPGHYITYSNGDHLAVTNFFNINDYQRNATATISLKEETVRLQDCLYKSVDRQLMSDVKLGCQLSGGVDSSVVTWLAKEIKKDNLLETVSIIFDDKRFTEKEYIDKVATQLQLVAHQFTLDPDFYQQNFSKATWHFEGPINHPNTIGIYLLAQRAREYVTVLLSGEGADEVFGGYRRFYDMQYPFINKGFLSGIKNALPNPFSYISQYSKPANRAVMANAFMSKALAKKLKPGFTATNAVNQRLHLFDSLSGSVFDKQVKYEFNTYLPDLLIRQDKMSMAHSIENRVPFLDNEVVAHSFTMPEKYLIKRKAAEGSNTEKYILKKLCASIFGNEFSFRNKMGFGIPLRGFMTKPSFNDYLRQEIFPGIAQRKILDAATIEGWINNLPTISSKELDALWIAISLELWMKQFIDR